MFEPTTVLGALTASGLISVLLGAAGRRTRRGGAWTFSLAAGLGFYLGLAMLGVRPRWPFREDQDRFLGLVMPSILIAEAGFLGTIPRPSWGGGAARLVAAAAVAPAILHGSVYVADLDGPGSAAWPPLQRFLILGVLGLATACNWSVLLRIVPRTGAAAVLTAQATAIMAAGPAIALSGYASGGLIAGPLAAALLGAAAAPAPAVGAGLFGLSSLLMMGACFGSLGTVEAGVLFVAPLLVGVPEIVLRSRPRPRLGAMLGVALTACAAAAAVVAAWRRFAFVASAC